MTYYYPHHFILFDQTKIAETFIGFLKSFRETNEIKKKIIYRGISINRDEGDFTTSSIYNSSIKG